MTAAVVDNRLADILWHIGNIAENTIYATIGEIRILRDSSIQIINIRLMMLINKQYIHVTVLIDMNYHS